MNKFWDKVLKCKHEPTNNYLADFTCETPYCEATEYHCKKCGAYITECGCGFNNGISGWSHSRCITENKKKGII